MAQSLTEQEAKAKRCHLTMSGWWRTTPPHGLAQQQMTRCVGNDCIAWVFDVSGVTGNCTLLSS